MREPIDVLVLLRELYSRLSVEARRVEGELRALSPVQFRKAPKINRRLEDIRAQRRACLAEIAARENAPRVVEPEPAAQVRTTAQLRAAIERARR